MAARSTGIFPREGFSLDNAFKLDDTGSTKSPVNLRHCRTFRVVMVNTVLTGAAILGIEIYGNVVASFDAAELAAAKDPNGVVTIHLRGYNLLGLTEVVNYAVVLGGGTFSTGGIYIELVDGPAR